jgi:hypothetical protein
MITKAFSLGAAGVLLALFSQETASAQSAPVVINSVPYTITNSGTYILGSDLDYSMGSGAAIFVDFSNVTLDLNHHALRGFNAGTGSQAVGVYVNGRPNVEIKNGSVGGFYKGIVFKARAGFEPRNTSGTVHDMLINYNLFRGIQFDTARACAVKNCQISGTGFDQSGNVIPQYQGPAQTGLVGTTVAELISLSGPNAAGGYAIDSINATGANLVEGNLVSNTTGTGINIGALDLADNNVVVTSGRNYNFQAGSGARNNISGQPGANFNLSVILGVASPLHSTDLGGNVSY